MPTNPGGRPPRRPHDSGDRTNRPRPNHYHHDSTRPEPGRTTVRSDPWQSVSALQLGLHPRPFRELHFERMYLLEKLQQHDERALQLFGRVPDVDEQIEHAKNQSEDRRAKKLRGWLRHRITDIVEEEKKTLERLSELHVEIQCQERWRQVDEGRTARGLPQQNHNPNYSGFAAPPAPPWPYGDIRYPNMPYWNPFPAPVVYPGPYWAGPAHVYPLHMPEAPDTPEGFGAGGTFVASGSNTLNDGSVSHSETAEGDHPEAEQGRRSTPSTTGEDEMEYAWSRRDSV
ncbi:uncharacterized protein F4812DRAFT_469313 [Daldinia caldariorum]|uniref:uncharacterized protein n=1 Tax=Daldinia caldariorum TaxID=326644 RepID=UPI002008A09F|nr:uncharacterized protein F4812DRAFT_469313 [Daldinia caldariorum]KAI1470804.1 hypothetical protein F4812DRAFT_469313 [Daldinia caldariorum]